MVRYLPIREIPFKGGGSPFPYPDSHWLKLLPSFGALIIFLLIGTRQKYCLG